MISNKDKEKYLVLFMYTVKEYKRMVYLLPLDFTQDILEEINEDSYAAINLRAILARKYISRSDKVHINKIVTISKSLYPEKEDKFEQIYQEFIAMYNELFLQISHDGLELNLRETFDDVIYGVFLHADFDRISRLHNTNEHF